MKSQFKIILVGALALFALSYFIWNTYQNARSAETMRNWVDHSYTVVARIDVLSTDVTQLESDSRGYLLTGNPEFLVSAKQHASYSEELLKELEQLTSYNPPQHQRIATLAPLVREKIQFQLGLLNTNSANNPALKASPVRGKELMDAIDRRLQEERQIELGLLKGRIQSDKDFVRLGFITTLAGTITALVFIAIILWQLNTDIIRRKRAEQSLHQMKNLLQAILDNIPLMIQVKDLKGRYLLVNKQLKETFGYTDKMLLGKTDHDVEPAVADEYERTDKQAIETLQPVPVDESVVINNKQYHFHYIKFALRDESGRPFAVGGFGMDMTEKREAAEKLQRSEEHMRALLSSTNEGFFMINRDYKLVLINEAGKSIARFNGYLATEPGEDIRDRIPEERKGNVMNLLNRVFTGEAIEYEAIYRNGTEERNYLVSYLPVREGNQITSVVVVSKDITELIKYRHQMVEAKRKAESAEKLQEQFLANISHEIRTPLNGIIGMANLLQKTSLNVEQRDFVSIVKYSSDNLLVLINDILDFSKIKAGKLNIEQIEFNIWDIVQKAVSALQVKAKEKDLGLLIFFHDDVPRLIKGDPYRLNQIISNLLSNAIKFTQKGYIRIEITCKKASPSLCNMRFRIKDTGIGIPVDKLAMIFESFTQASEDVTRKFGGTGLGLTITKQLVELQGGNIRVESEEGVGTSVTFELPYEAMAENAASRAAIEELGAQAEHISFTGKRILVVEDNEINRKVMAYNLEPMGIHLTMANEGREAIQVLEKGERFDLIIMDLQMPVMNGFQAAVYIRQKLRLSTPILAMTASALKNEEVKCFELGMNEYLTKPFAPEELEKILEHYLNGRKTASDRSRGYHAAAEKPSYNLDYISVKRKPDVIAHVLGIILQESPHLFQEVSNCILNEDWKGAHDRAHKLKSSMGLLQLNEILELLDRIEVFTAQRKNLDQLPAIIEAAIEKFNLVKPILEAERDAAVTAVES